MLTTIKQRLDRDEELGFTLIELMVVVLIIAILLAIAIPTFLGAKSTANARAAQSNIRNALTAEQTVFTNNNQQFSADTSANGVLQTAEPNLAWATADTATRSPSQVDVQVATNSSANDSVFIMAYGKDGNCYTVQQINQSTPTIPAGTSYSVSKPTGTPALCAFPSALAAPAATGNASANVGGGFYPAW
jgi:type IV pilus assembly protein PilA